MKERKNIIVIGSGNVGTHLAHGLADSKLTISGIWSRDSINADKISKELNCPVISDLTTINPEDTDLAIICVVDDAIQSVLEELPKEIPVAYTSGSIRLDQLPERKEIGVFYPLQTFSKNKAVDLSIVPFLIEASDEHFATELNNIARALSDHVIYADSEARYQVHIAAVMVNNFTNHIFSLAKDHMNHNELSFELLKPLINETVDKINELDPYDAQTGPAKRGDLQVIEKHLSSLKGRTKEIYKLLSTSIIEKHKSK